MDRVRQLKARYMTMEIKHTAHSIHTWKFRSLVSKAINSELKTNFSLKIIYYSYPIQKYFTTKYFHVIIFNYEFFVQTVRVCVRDGRW